MPLIMIDLTDEEIETLVQEHRARAEMVWAKMDTPEPFDFVLQKIKDAIIRNADDQRFGWKEDDAG